MSENLVFFLDKIKASSAGLVPYLVIYILVLVLSLFRKEKKEYRTYFTYPALVLLVTICNPLLVVPLAEKIGLDDRFYRLFWLFPIAITLAVYGVVLLNKTAGKWRGIISAVLLCLVLAKAGTMSLPYIVKADNIYKVSNETLELSKELETTAQEKNCLYSDTQLLELRQYDPSIGNALGRKELHDLDVTKVDSARLQRFLKKGMYEKYLGYLSRTADQSVDPQGTKTCLEALDIHYIIVNKAQNMGNYYTALGCSLYNSTANYEIYEVK